MTTEQVRRRAAVLLALVVLLVVVGVAGFAVGRGSGPDRPAPPGPSAVDVGFSQDMAVHHQQAILMSTLAQTRGGPTVRSIASGILAGQSEELGAMRGWLRLWGRPAADPQPMAWMEGMSGMSGMGMPGMASPGQLTRLAGLSGRRFDVLFLQLMIRHHQGGIAMAADARRRAALPAVRAGAASMIVQQVEDIGAMRALLRADGGNPLPAP